MLRRSPPAFQFRKPQTWGTHTHGHQRGIMQPNTLLAFHSPALLVFPLLPLVLAVEKWHHDRIRLSPLFFGVVGGKTINFPSYGASTRTENFRCDSETCISQRIVLYHKLLVCEDTICPSKTKIARVCLSFCNESHKITLLTPQDINSSGKISYSMLF